MREIKFRAVYKGELLNRVCVPFNIYDELTKPCNHDEAEFGKGVIFEQFTGLHDKNGKEIYEGDVVLHDESDSGGDYEKFIVSFGKHHYDSGCYPFMGFGLDPIGAPDMDRHYRMFGQDEIEVIGNIHENPELLNAH